MKAATILALVGAVVAAPQVDPYVPRQRTSANYKANISI